MSKVVGTLPMRLDRLSEEITPGAIFKNLDNDGRAMFVEWMEDGERLVVIMPPKGSGLGKKGQLPEPEQYRVQLLRPREFHKWLVLHLGTNSSLEK